MGRQKLPDQAKDAVRAALEGLSVKAEDVSAWLSAANHERQPVADGTLKNYRYGRRLMPPKMRRLLAKQLRRHADQLCALARDLEDNTR
jgi:hypothetical protein